MNLYTRRTTLRAGLGALTAFAVSPALAGASLPNVIVNKDPNCGCCQKWADHLAAAGFPVQIVAQGDLAPLKAKLGVTDELRSCHTAEVDGYVLEGHVPADAVLRLLRERPTAIGLAVPGMPAGSPGMEGGTPETYDVILFGNDFRKTYARYRGTASLPV